MLLANLQRDLKPEDEDGYDDWVVFDDSAARAAEIELSKSCYLVYFDPNRQRKIEFEYIIQRYAMKRGINPENVSFECLPLTNLNYWSPFHSRKAEERYERRGYSDLLQPWLPIASSAKWPRGNQGNHRAYKSAVDALSGLYVLADAVVSTVKRMTKAGLGPEWLSYDVAEILAPVYGRRSTGKLGRQGPDIPLIWQNGLLMGCSDFSTRRMVVPSYVVTRATVQKLENDYCEPAFDMTRLELKRRLAQELDDPETFLGYAISPDAVALWICQSVMQLRIVVEEMRQSFDPDLQKTSNVGNRNCQAESKMVQKIECQYRKTDEYNNPTKYITPAVWRSPFSLMRRSLASFHGVACVSLEVDDLRQGYGDVEYLAHWLGKLRHTRRRTTMNAALARLIVDIADDNLDVSHDSEWYSVARFLTSLVPGNGWKALVDVAIIILESEAEKTYEIKYTLSRENNPANSVILDHDECSLEIFGPLIRVPPERAREIEMKSRKLESLEIFGPVGRHLI